MADNKLFEKNIESLKYMAEKLDLPECFGPYEDDDENVYEMVSNADAHVYTGASKCVLVNDEMDYVIKIPFGGMWYESYDEDGYIDDDYWGDYTYADDLGEGGSTWDYCENELAKFEKAEEDGFAEFFADTRFLGRFSNYPIYAQEKAVSLDSARYSQDENERSLVNHSPNAENVYDSRCKSINTFPIAWAMSVIDYYGEERAIEFFEYTKNERYTDMHSGNVGYAAADGRPVLIDWAGWRD